MDDGDGYGRTEDGINSCTPEEGFVSKYNDCNDNDSLINPDAQEICDEGEVDENCNGVKNESENDGVLSVGTQIFYADSDGDGFGNEDSSMQLCAKIDTYVEDSTDCDDSNDDTQGSEAAERRKGGVAEDSIVSDSIWKEMLAIAVLGGPVALSIGARLAQVRLRTLTV